MGDGGVEPYNYAPYMGLSTQFYRTNPPSFPLGEVGLTIDRCIRPEGDIPWKSRS